MNNARPLKLGEKDMGKDQLVLVLCLCQIGVDSSFVDADRLGPPAA